MQYSIKKDYDLGKCSNIPLCCIIFYIAIWRYVYKFNVAQKLQIWFQRKFRGLYNRNIDADDYKETDYIKCPICVIRNKGNELYRCFTCVKQYNCKYHRPCETDEYGVYYD